MATSKKPPAKKKPTLVARVRGAATRLAMRGSSEGKGRETTGTMRAGRNLDRYLDDIENGGRRKK